MYRQNVPKGRSEVVERLVMELISRAVGEPDIRGTWAPSRKLKFTDTEGERARMIEAARQYNEEVEWEMRLVAHGSKGFTYLRRALNDGALRHERLARNYGSLGQYSKKPALMGGFWDSGWGEFVTTPAKLDECFQKPGEKYVVPLVQIDCLLFPTPIVGVLQQAFPQYATKMKGFTQMAQELESAVKARFKLPDDVEEPY